MDNNNPAPNQEKKVTILIVEDDKFLRELLVRKLDGEGLNTLTAVDGNEALKVVKENVVQIILLDLILPGMDGFDVLKEIKADANTAKIPVIILSNLGQKEEVEKGLKLGANDYMIKAHFTPDEIVEKIKKVLGDSYF
jgi:DNA-binding response OmpR family regulator